MVAGWRPKQHQRLTPEPPQARRRYCGSKAIKQVFGGEGVKMVLLVMILGAIAAVSMLWPTGASHRSQDMLRPLDLPRPRK
jgi:hypothetical protein